MCHFYFTQIGQEMKEGIAVAINFVFLFFWKFFNFDRAKDKCEILNQLTFQLWGPKNVSLTFRVVNRQLDTLAN